MRMHKPRDFPALIELFPVPICNSDALSLNPLVNSINEMRPEPFLLRFRVFLTGRSEAGPLYSGLLAVTIGSGFRSKGSGLIRFVEAIPNQTRWFLKLGSCLTPVFQIHLETMVRRRHVTGDQVSAFLGPASAFTGGRVFFPKGPSVGGVFRSVPSC
jgi:hypothetical protein